MVASPRLSGMSVVWDDAKFLCDVGRASKRRVAIEQGRASALHLRMVLVGWRGCLLLAEGKQNKTPGVNVDE